MLLFFYPLLRCNVLKSPFLSIANVFFGISSYLNPEAAVLLSQLNREMAPRFGKLNKALADLVDDYSMVNFIPLDLRKESSIQYVLSNIDNCIQYGEDADVKVKDYIPEGDED
jgi:hypothetical protein